MFGWFLRGIGSRVVTTRYPAEPDHTPGATPGRPVHTVFESPQRAAAAAATCPVGAILARDAEAAVDTSRCVQCRACARGEAPMQWLADYSWARFAPGRGPASRPGHPFKKSLHIRFVDTGSCDAVIQEIKQLGKPFYNMHRLGFFITPTPRHADVLMMTGVVTAHMRLALKKTYDAMPAPKWVIAVGNCAISGCLFAPSFMAVGAAGAQVPIDVLVPGCPPPPLAILHGLLLLAGREKELPAQAETGVLP